MTRRRMARFIICAALGMVAGCARYADSQSPPARPEMKPAPKTPLAMKREKLGKPSWNPEWDRIVEEALPPEMLSASVASGVRPFACALTP